MNKNELTTKKLIDILQAGCESDIIKLLDEHTLNKYNYIQQVNPNVALQLKAGLFITCIQIYYCKEQLENLWLAFDVCIDLINTYYQKLYHSNNCRIT